MNNENGQSNHYLFTLIGLFIVILYIFAVFCIDNIHQDGLVYSTIARNMNNALGSIWHPAYSEYQYAQFYEHPGLGLWLGSCFFSLLGDHAYTEKIFSVFIAIINISYFIFFWKTYSKYEVDYSNGWIVIFFWFLVPLFLFYYPSNSLEMLANTFAIPSIHFLLLSLSDNNTTKLKLTYRAISALLIMISFLINGPLTLFPLALYLCHYIVFKAYRFRVYAEYSIQLLFLFMLFIGMACYFNEGLCDNLTSYLQTQLLAMMTGERVDLYFHGIAKLHIIQTTMNQYIFSALMVLFLLYLYRKYHGKESYYRYLYKSATDEYIKLFFLVGLTALLPITLSSKQFSHYSLQGCFFFTLTFALFITPLCLESVKKISFKRLRFYSFFVLVLLGMSLLFDDMNISSRINKAYLYLYEQIDPQNSDGVFDDSKKIGHYLLGKTNVVSIPMLDYRRPPRVISTYLMRWYQISVGKIEDSSYLMVDKRLLPDKRYHLEVIKLIEAFPSSTLIMDLKLYRLYRLHK